MHVHTRYPHEELLQVQGLCMLPYPEIRSDAGAQVHERHLNTDLLLALTRALLLQRPDLRVVVMSATINVQAYSDYFGAAPVITVGVPSGHASVMCYCRSLAIASSQLPNPAKAARTSSQCCAALGWCNCAEILESTPSLSARG